MLRVPFALVVFLSLPATVPVLRAAAAKPLLRDAVLRCCVLHADPFMYSASHPVSDHQPWGIFPMRFDEANN